MVRTDDAHSMRDRLDKARENLAEADIDDRDRTAISQFADHREINEGVAHSTLRDDIEDLRRLSERADRHLIEFESVKDANAVLKRNAREYDVSERSNDNYRKAIRVFFEWLDEDDDHDAYGWWDEVTIPSRETKSLDPDEVLSPAEVEQLRQAATHAREKALIEFLADTGMRITAALQLRRRDVSDLDTRQPTVATNRDGAGQKGMDPLPRPIIHSAQHLRVYLNEHHPDDHPRAPVFASKYYGGRDRENGAIHPTTTSQKLKSIAKEAGINRDRVNNHAFRHVAVTRMRRDMNMDWDDIAHRTGWSQQSLSRMKEVYAHLSNQDKNDRIWAAAGRDVDDNDADTPTFTECVNCGAEIATTARVCPQCGADQDAEWREQQLRRALAELDPETADQLIAAVESIED